MNERLKRTALIVTIAAFVLMVLSIVVDVVKPENVKDLFGENMLGNAWPQAAIGIIALVFAFIYIMKNAVKEAAPFYKGFFIAFLLMNFLYGVSLFISAHLCGAPGEIPILFLVAFIFWLIGSTAVLYLAFAPNLGKNRSLTLAIIAAAAFLAPVFVSLFHDFYEGMLFRNIAKILMVFLLYLLILAKYQNKDTRDAV